VFACAHQVLTEKKKTAVLIPSSALAAAMGYGCKNSILPLVSFFYA
jgi:hypothetical protein